MMSSVREGERKEGELKVIKKAEDFAAYTLRVCTNEKVFPKRYRWCITNRIIDSAFEILNCVNRANEVRVITPSDYILRRNFQLTAISEVSAIEDMMNVSYRMFKSAASRVKQWSGLLRDVKVLLNKWTYSDYKRYKSMT